MDNEYVATFTTSDQITADDFRLTHPSFKCTNKTTVQEIKDFYKKNSHEYSRFEVLLIEMY